MTMQKPISKIKDVIPTAWHVTNPDYIGYITIDAETVYTDIFKTQYGDLGEIPSHLLATVAKNYNWDFMLPFGKPNDATLLNYFGSSMSNINNNAIIKDNICIIII